jgi:3-oxoacid CoA-transferase B subunit
MDLAAGARRVIVAMEHTTRQGQPRIVSECSYPLTAEKCVNLIVTNLAVIEVTEGGLVLKETAPDVSVAEVQAATDASLQVSAQMRVMDL